MADITVRHNNGNQQSAVTREDPFRALRDIFRWDPFQEMMPSVDGRSMAFTPAFEVKETKNSYEFMADVPGIKEQDIDITITGNRLTVSGKREEEKEERGDTYYTCERSYGSFSRSFTLPEGADVDHLQADLKAGVLTLVVPKRPEVQPKKIALKSNEKATKS